MAKRKLVLYTEDDLMKLSVAELLDLYQNSIEVIKTIQQIINPIKTPNQKAAVSRPSQAPLAMSDDMFPVFETPDLSNRVPTQTTKKAAAVPQDNKINMGDEIVGLVDVTDPDYLQKAMKGTTQPNNLYSVAPVPVSHNVKESSPVPSPTAESVKSKKAKDLNDK